MRTTKTQLTKKQAIYVEKTTEEKHKAINPKTKEKISIDFSKDLYSLVDTLSPHKELKNIFEMDEEIADGYIKRKVTDYYKVLGHYSTLRRFLREFTHTRLYQHLQSLNNPERALEMLLDMFSPPPKSKKGKNGQGGQGNQQDKNNNQGSGESPEEQDNQNSQNSNGQGKEGKEEMDNSSENELSNNPPPPLMDFEKFNKNIPKIEQALKNNVLDDNIMRGVMEKNSGTKHNTLSTIEGLAENINNLSQFFTDERFEILDVARKIGLTEQYKREEDVSDVMYPEKDWRITNMKMISDLPKVLPHQFLYPDKLFDKMLIDKELKVKQYQNRRKKKQVLYILIDGSGSMDSLKQVVACGIAVAYIKKAISEGSYYFFRFFDEDTFELHTVTNEQEAIKEIDYLLNNPRSGGGTSIDNAIKVAIKDISDPKKFKQDSKDRNTDLYDRADILVITDGEDYVDITKKELEDKKIVLHSFLLGEDSYGNKALETISTTYEKLDSIQMNKLNE